MAEGSKGSLQHIFFKVPPFFKHTPDTWFVHLEAQFDTRKITASLTKFYWASSDLHTNISNQLTHLIRDLGEDPYQDIKDCLISLYSLSPHQRFKALINLSLTSNTTPSILMNLYSKKYKLDFVFIGLFLRRMPQTIWHHLLSLDIQNPDALAKKADALFHSQQSSSVHLLSDDPIYEI